MSSRSDTIEHDAPGRLAGQNDWQSTAHGIHLRSVELDNPELACATAELSSAERARAARFRFPLDRSRFVAAHVALRRSLSDRLGRASADIHFVEGPNGKPMLPPELGWVFNLSHSQNAAFIVLAPSARHSDIGVDVECVSPVRDWESLAAEHFSREEFRTLVSLEGPASRTRAFLRCWTRKEACVKALGCGLTLPTNIFTTGLDAVQKTIAIEVDGQSRLVDVETVFEDEACIASIAWCHKPQ